MTKQKNFWRFGMYKGKTNNENFASFDFEDLGIKELRLISEDLSYDQLREKAQFIIEAVNNAILKEGV